MSNIIAEHVNLSRTRNTQYRFTSKFDMINLFRPLQVGLI